MWGTLVRHWHSELPATRDISALMPPYLSKHQHPSRPWEYLPITYLQCQALLHLGKIFFPGSLGGQKAAGSQDHAHPASPAPLPPQNQEPGRGVGLDRQALGGSYYLCGTMGTVSHKFKASVITEIRQPDLCLVPKSKGFARGPAMSQWQGEEGSQALLPASTCPC